MKKRLLSILLCLVMAMTLLPTAMAAGRFTDVTEKDWFYSDVEYAVAQGLVNGTTTTTYSPESNLTYAAAIKLAACMHKKVTQGNSDFTVGTPWYQVYVDYARDNGIIPAGKTYNWDAPATRADYMEIFANAIPDTGLKSGYTGLSAMNKVDDGAIPDVSMTHPQATAIYKLYRAGILQGDGAHNCNPGSYIRRSEVAAILTRMMNAAARISFEMTTTPANSLTVSQQPANATAALGEKAQFTVAVSGGKGPYTYKWYSSADGASWTAIVNSSLYSGSATATLSVKADASTGLSYRCEITDSTHSSVTSGAARLTVGASTLVISQQPADASVALGEKAQFTVAVSGGKGPYTYKWYSSADGASWTAIVNSSLYSGSATATLSVKADASTGLSYRCEITDSTHASVTSGAARLTVGASTLAISQQPQDVYGKVDDWVSYSVGVSGGKAPYTYQWQNRSDDMDWANTVNGSYLKGATAATLETQILDEDFTYGYQYRCRITDANGSVVYSDVVRAIEQTGRNPDATPIRPSTSTSTGSTETDSSTPSRPSVSVSTGSTETDSSTPSRPTATVSTSTDALHITTQPVNASAVVDAKVTFTVEIANGKGPYSHQWQYSTDDGKTWLPVANSTKYSGSQTKTLTVKIDGTDNSSRIYRCKIEDAAHTVVYTDSVIAQWVRPTVAGG